MRLRRPFGLAWWALHLAVWLAAGATPAETQTTGTQARGASLAGTVTAPDGARLPAVVIALAPRNGSPAVTTVSGPQGAFRLSGLAAGVYTLEASLEGFATRRISDLTLAEGEGQRLDLRLDLMTVRELLHVLTDGPDETVEATAVRECGARDAAEVLASVPGVGKTRRGLIGSDVTMRGFHGQDVNVLVDGQRVCGACPSRMDPPAFHVDLGEIERVEVLRGPFDVKNGGGLGGAINIVTRRPTPGWRVQPTLVLGSTGYVNPVLAASYGGRHTSALAGVSYREARPYTDGTGQPATRVANYREGAATGDAFRVGTAWARLMRHGDEGLLQLAYTRQQAEHVLYPTLQMDAITDDTDRVQLTWDGVHTKASAGVARVTHWMTDEYRLSAANMARSYSMGTRAESRTFGLRGEWQGGGFSVGAEAGHRLWETETEMAGRAYLPQASLAGATCDTVGLFAEWEHDFTVAHGLSVGLRLERATTRVDEATGNTELFFAYHGTRDTDAEDLLPAARLRYNWRPRPGLRLSLTAGHAARLPEPNERYFALRRAGSDWVGNPGLRPSRSTGGDLNAHFEAARLRLDGSLFVNAVADYITVAARDKGETVAGVVNTRARTYENVNATLAGLEARASLLLPARLFLDVDASYVRGRQQTDSARGLTSEAVAEIPPLTGHVALRYDDGRRWLRLEAAGAARQRRINRDLGETETPGYGILNVAAGLRLRRLVLTAGVVNLLDDAYAEHLSSQRDPFRSGARLLEPGRQVFVSVVTPF
jgi:iron complex outermembrane recepter protein